MDEEEELKSAFNLMDLDHNGYITKDELAESLKAMGHNMSAEEVEQLIKEADLNGDGKVDFEEFKAIMRKK